MILADLIDRPLSSLSEDELENLIATLKNIPISESDTIETLKAKPVRQKVSNETKRATSLVNNLTPEQRAKLAEALKSMGI